MVHILEQTATTSIIGFDSRSKIALGGVNASADDWLSAAELIRRLDRAIPPAVCDAEIVLIDDCSVWHITKISAKKAEQLSGKE